MNQISNTLPSGNTTGSWYASSTQTKKPPEDDTQLQQTNSSADSVNIISSTGTAVNQTVSPAGTSISPAYSVEISEEGTQLNSLNASKTGEEPPTGNPSASSPDNATSSVNDASQTSGSSASSAPASSVESATEDDSASDTTSLSQYNDSQLKSMLNKGKITQTEYNAEIAKREAKKQIETANATSTANANVD
jgi:hypothetical protein